MKSQIIAPLLVSALAMAPAANAGKYKDNGHNSFTDTARVISAEPIYTSVSVTEPRQECGYEEVAYYDEYEPRRRYRSDHGNSAVGMIIGGVVGGAVGNEFGHSTNSKIAGAVIGSAIGHDIAGQKQVAHRAHHRDSPRYREEHRCRTVTERHREERITGYRVQYRYHGHTFSKRMDRDPGSRVRVRVNVTPGIH